MFKFLRKHHWKVIPKSGDELHFSTYDAARRYADYRQIYDGVGHATDFHNRKILLMPPGQMPAFVWKPKNLFGL